MKGLYARQSRIWKIPLLIAFLIASVVLLAGCSGQASTSTASSGGSSGVSGSDNSMAVAAGNQGEGAQLDQTGVGMGTKIAITANGSTMTATLADNSSAEALAALLEEGPLTVDMSDYASMEKVGPIGQSLPTNDEQITTGAGDIILYQGSALVIYYAPNSWSFTRLGRIDDEFVGSLRDTLGTGDVQVTLELA